MKKTLKLNESEFKSHVREIVLEHMKTLVGEEPPFPYYPRQSFKSEFDEMADNDELNEGLIRTYPSEWVGEYLAKRANSDFKSITYDEHYNQFFITIKPGSKSIEPLKKKMDSFGYYCGAEHMGLGGYFMQFEAKFDEYLTGKELGEMYDNPVFYHVAPIYYKDKILAKGLVPKSKNDFLKYPDRVHFILAIEGKAAIKRMAKLLYMKSDSEMNNGKYSLLGITLDGLDNVKFYPDRNVDDWKAFFTYENIPSKNIVFIEDFDVNNI